MNDITIYPEAAKPHPAFEVHKVLDHGFVRLVDAMPSPTDPYAITADEAIAQAARVSYGKGTKTVSDDAALVAYLIKHHHSTPVEMVELKFHMRIPIFVARQMIRHRTFSYNEYSGRYSVINDLYYVPEKDHIKPQSTDNKQGRGGEFHDDTPEHFIAWIRDNSELAYKDYEHFTENKVAKEITRIGLPVNYYTEWYSKVNLHNLFHFLRLRCDSHSQYETRVYALKMLDIVRLLAPIATAAFENNVQHSITLSVEEQALLKEVIGSEISDAKLESAINAKKWSKRRTKEFLDVISKLR